MSEGPDTPLHQIFVHLIGYETASFLLHDYPQEMDRLLGVMLEKNEEGLALTAASPAPVILTPDNTNADFETPKLFQKYSLPYLKKASQTLHNAGKVHVAHMCGKLKALLPLINQAGLDGIESLTPPPFADTHLWDARAALPEVCIIGGVSPHLLVGQWSRSEIESYMTELFRRMAPGNNWILAVSDDTPANADIERFLWVSELVEKYGSLPLA
jgi:uroporphyrinogen-III decarboxylase